MKIHEMIGKLYNVNADVVINIVNQSKYAADAPIDTLAIHTGFTFNNHTGKKFELLFDFDKETLYRQVLLEGSNGPKVIGAVYSKKKNYFDFCLLVCFVAVDSSGGALQMRFDSKAEYDTFLLDYNTFKIYNKISNIDEKPISELPVKRSFETVLFMGTQGISRYVSPEDWRNEEDESYTRDLSDDAEDETESWDEDFPGWRDGRDV